jgi:glycosyltransferase involved in cell wall biosynthesis
MCENLTIIIPSKNEGSRLYECIRLISEQYGMLSTRVIISDSSDSMESVYWITRILHDFSQKLHISVIKGGFPGEARHKGMEFVKTPYVLFLDADIMLHDKTVIYNSLQYEYPLVTVTFSTEKDWNWVYRVFDIFQRISVKIGSPFALGGYQMWKTEEYYRCGGFNPEFLFAEDYKLSSKASKMKIHRVLGVWTSARRFKTKGVKWMFKMMLDSYINRNNDEFFKKHHNYWE